MDNPPSAAVCIQSNKGISFLMILSDKLCARLRLTLAHGRLGLSSHEKTSAVERHEEEEKSDDVLIDVVNDDSSSLLSSTMEEPVDLQIEKPILKGIEFEHSIN